jgi:ABC-2 type transport system ATP-binding protein
VVTEYLEFFSACYNIHGQQRKKVVKDVLDLTDLNYKATAEVNSLSRGMQQRLSIARVLLHDPKVVLLDEPFTGLDPDASDRLAETLRQLHDGKRAVVMTTHDLDRGLALCDRALLIARGRLAYVARRDEIAAAGFRETYGRATRH